MTYKIGNEVRVKKGVDNPVYGWGHVKRGEIGAIKSVDSDGDLTIDFPSQSGWRGTQSEMELAIAKALKKGSPVLITDRVLKEYAEIKKAELKEGTGVMVEAGKKTCGGDEYKAGLGKITSLNSCSSDEEFPYKVEVGGKRLCIGKDALQAVRPTYWFEGKASGTIEKEGEEEYAVKIKKCPSNQELEGKVIKVPSESLDELVKKVHPLEFSKVKPILVWEKFIMQTRTGGELVNSDGDGCYTDGKKIYLPSSVGMAEHMEDIDSTIFDNPNLTVYAGLMLHEIAHIRYGSFKLDMEECMKEIRHKEAFKSILNILEDNRVESYLQREYRGTDYERILDETRNLLIEKSKLPKNPFAKLLLSYHLRLVGFNYKGIPFIDKKKREALDKDIDAFLAGQSPIGKKSYREISDEIFELSKDIKDPRKTVLHTLRIAKKVYGLLEPLLKADDSLSPPDKSDIGAFTGGARDKTSDRYEKGDVKVNPESIDSKELEERISEGSEEGMPGEEGELGEGRGEGKEPGGSKEGEGGEGSGEESWLIQAVKIGLIGKGYDAKRAGELAKEVESFIGGEKR